MAELNENDEDIIRLAGMKKNFAWILVVFCLIIPTWVFIDTMLVFPESKASETSTQPDSEQIIYEPVVFDSTEISNGIHIPTGMIADTGCAEVVRNCGACHSLDLVKQNRQTKDGWKHIILWMQETQKLWDLGPQEEIIVHYLAKNYGPENTGRRPNLQQIEWYQLD